MCGEDIKRSESRGTKDMKDETESRVNKECESEVMMEERDIWGKFQARCHGEVRNSQRKKLFNFFFLNRPKSRPR